MTTDFLGIDVAKAKVDVALLKAGKVYQAAFKNTPKGFIALQQWLEKHNSTQLHIAMEATGSYWKAIANFLFQNGCAVSVINPAQVNAFAKSELLRAKTDKVDAGAIARFCRAMNPKPWKPLSQALEELRSLVRRLQELKEMRLQESNRQQDPGFSCAAQLSVEKMLTVLDKEIARIEKQIKAHIDQFPQLKAHFELLKTIPGIAEKTAAVLLAEIGDLANYRSARQLAAHAGLTPRHRQSGSSIHGKSHIAKTGNGRLRRALFLPAIVAKKSNPIIKDFCQRLLEAGKPKMVVIVVAMRKLLHIVYGVLKAKEVFNPNYLHAQA